MVGYRGWVGCWPELTWWPVVGGPHSGPYRSCRARVETRALSTVLLRERMPNVEHVRGPVPSSCAAEIRFLVLLPVRH